MKLRGENNSQTAKLSTNIAVSEMVFYNERVEMNKNHRRRRRRRAKENIAGLYGFMSFHIYYAISEALVLIANLMINKLKSKVQFGPSLIVAIASS